MNDYTPDRWVVVNFDNNGERFNKVLVEWKGSYLDGDYWRMNSGITEAIEDPDHWLFYSASGSIYRCAKERYGVTGLAANVLQNGSLLSTLNGSQNGSQNGSLLSTLNGSQSDSMDSLLAQAGSQLPFSPEERPSGMPGAREGPGFLSKTISSIQKRFGPEQQVFNINRNIYTYDEAAPLCKAMGAELATYEQVKEAQKHGADWCNYGWVKGQMAVYPTNEATWNKIQTGPKEYRNACGKPGVNGGHFDNPELRFGVNCFGARPEKKDTDTLLFDTESGLPPTAEQIEFDKKVQKFRDEMENITVLPWNRGSWSS